MEQPDDGSEVAELTCSYCGSPTCPAATDISAACPEEEADMLEEEDDLLDEDLEYEDEGDGGPDKASDEAI